MDSLEGKSEPETIDFPMKIWVRPVCFSLKHTHWNHHENHQLTIKSLFSYGFPHGFPMVFLWFSPWFPPWNPYVMTKIPKDLPRIPWPRWLGATSRAGGTTHPGHLDAVESMVSCHILGISWLYTSDIHVYYIYTHTTYTYDIYIYVMFYTYIYIYDLYIYICDIIYYIYMMYIYIWCVYIYMMYILYIYIYHLIYPINIPLNIPTKCGSRLP